MRQEEMQLVLSISTEMDRLSETDSSEHEKIRLSKKARAYYQPSEWRVTNLTVQGIESSKKLRIGQAIKKDIKKYKGGKIEQLGFVTTETYNKLAGTNKPIWISESSNEIKIGADPEFVVTDGNGAGIYGDTAMGYDFHDPAKKAAKFGSDGPCIELRPDPSDTPEGLVERIKSLLQSPEADKIQDLTWVGGATYRDRTMSRRYPIGGHIHFGLPNLPGAAKNTNQMLQNQIARILDELVAVPLVRIDTPMAGDRRVSLNFGRFNEIRGGNKKFEWRVPSGIWLIHPTLSFAVLSIAKAVTEECWKKYEDRGCSIDFMLKPSNKDTLLKAFKCLDTETVRSLVNTSKISGVSTDLVESIRKRVSNMSTYPKYKEGIDLFFKICGAENAAPTKSQLLIKKGWLEGKSF